MRFLTIFAIFIYTLLFCIIGAVLIALSLRPESMNSVVVILGQLSHSNNLRLGMALTGLFLILIHISIAHLTIGKNQSKKTIAFENPYGTVTLSLAAIEDYIKKLTGKLNEIKEIKSTILAGKSGIEINTKATLYSDVNIPETTEKIQNMIKQRLEELLGIEEAVTIKIHITKIVSREESKEVTGKTEYRGFKGEFEYGKGGETG